MSCRALARDTDGFALAYCMHPAICCIYTALHATFQLCHHPICLWISQPSRCTLLNPTSQPSLKIGLLNPSLCVNFPQVVSVLSMVLIVGWMTRRYVPVAARPVYLIDTFCYKPPDRMKVSRENYIRGARMRKVYTASHLSLQSLPGSHSIGKAMLLPQPYTPLLMCARKVRAISFGWTPFSC